MAADGHLGITALSRVTLASAGLSCYSSYTWRILYCAMCLELLRTKLGKQCPRIVRVYSEMLENQVFPIPRDSLQVGGNQKERHYELMDKDEYRDISLHHLIRKDSNKFSKKIRDFDRLFQANRETPENVTDEQVCVCLFWLSFCFKKHLKVWTLSGKFCSSFFQFSATVRKL